MYNNSDLILKLKSALLRKRDELSSEKNTIEEDNVMILEFSDILSKINKENYIEVFTNIPLNFLLEYCTYIKLSITQEELAQSLFILKNPIFKKASERYEPAKNIVDRILCAIKSKVTSNSTKENLDTINEQIKKVDKFLVSLEQHNITSSIDYLNLYSDILTPSFLNLTEEEITDIYKYLLIDRLSFLKDKEQQKNVEEPILKNENPVSNIVSYEKINVDETIILEIKELKNSLENFEVKTRVDNSKKELITNLVSSYLSNDIDLDSIKMMELDEEIYLTIVSLVLNKLISEFEETITSKYSKEDIPFYEEYIKELIERISFMKNEFQIIIESKDEVDIETTKQANQELLFLKRTDDITEFERNLKDICDDRYEEIVRLLNDLEQGRIRNDLHINGSYIKVGPKLFIAYEKVCGYILICGIGYLKSFIGKNVASHQGNPDTIENIGKIIRDSNEEYQKLLQENEVITQRIYSKINKVSNTKKQ